MNEIIEKLVNNTIKEIASFGWADQSFILNEVSDKLVEYSHSCLMNEYGMKEEECESSD